MTEETKEQFDSPWAVADDKDEQGRYMVLDNNMAFVSKESTLKDANRIAPLPELYDALQEAIFEINRLIDALKNGTDFGDFCDKYLKEYGNVPSGFTCEWAQLLMKVRDGK